MHEFLLTPTLSISFQRYPYPPSGFVTTLPTSWGALPFIADAPGYLVLPCPDAEAFWIGLIPEETGKSTVVRVLASVASGDRIDVVTGAHVDRSATTGSADITVQRAYGVAGIPRGDGTWWPFARDAAGEPATECRGLDLFSPPVASVRVDLVGSAEFEELAGIRLPPLDPASRYGGWRLP